MSIVNDRVRDELRARFESRLTGPISLRLYTRPGSGRLILPAGVGCRTCDDAREIAESLRSAAPDKVSLEVVDVSRDGDQAVAAGVTDVPTFVIGRPDQDARIRFQGLPAGTEFAALVDAVERTSRDEAGLGQPSLEGLAKVTAPLELMVFATPT